MTCVFGLRVSLIEKRKKNNKWKRRKEENERRREKEKENEEEEERVVRDNEKAKKKNREPDVTFRIDKDAVRSRKIGSLTVATIDFDPASNSSSVHILDSFPLNSSVQTFTKTRHDSRERISLSRFNSLKKVGPSKVFSSSKLKKK